MVTVVPALLGLVQVVYWKCISDHFRYGDGNLGLVLQVHPLRVAIATDMGAFGGFFPVLKVVQHDFPLQRVQQLQVGEAIPTVALYARERSAYPQHWSDFHPMPVFCATADHAQIVLAASRKTEEDLNLLLLLVERSRSLEPGLYWFDPETLQPSDGPPA